MKHTKINNPDIQKIFNQYPKEVKKRIIELRSIIFEVARNNPKIGIITESLKWGEPKYQTNQTKSGSSISINHKKEMENNFSMCVLDTTNLIQTFKEIYPKTFYFNGNRELIINANKKMPKEEIYHCIELALTYNLKNKK
jgi:hypothetical protein